MTRCQIIAECATNHGGDIELAKEMICMAAASGADYVKFQAYQTKYLKSSDPQYAWLTQCELTLKQLIELDKICQQQMVKSLFSVFDSQRYAELKKHHLLIKVGHGDSHRLIGDFVSRAWINVIPLYPAPLEAVAAVKWDGNFWSDHAIGLDVAKYFVARGAAFIEKHFSLQKKGRNQLWDMTPMMLQTLRQWTEIVHTMQAGTPHSERWTHPTK